MPKVLFPALVFLLMLDGPVRGVISHFQSPYLHEAMGWLSYLGKGWIQAIPCLLLMMAGLFVKKDAQMEEAGRKSIYAIAIAGILVQTVKHLIGRPRPRVMDMVGLSLGPSFENGFDSFPSGHATSAFALAATLTAFYPKMRYPLYAYSILVSFSRIYLNAHFISDVFAGIVLGLWIGWVVTTQRGGEIKRMITGRGVILGIVALSILLFFYKLGTPSLFDVDEAVYAESAREMVETGDWITPQYNYTNRYDKPVLFYWLISSAYWLFGVTEFAARFWSASLGIGLVMLSYYFVRRAGNHQWGILSALIMATSLEVIVLSHAAITDITLTFFITSSLFCFFLGYTDQEGRKRRWYRGMYLTMALAVLTKGPVGIVIPAFIITLFLFFRGQIREVLREMNIFSGAILFLVVALPWYVTETWINGWEYIDAFFIKHHITRYTGIVSGHSGPLYYFIPVILLAFFPWSVFLPYGLIKSFQGVKRRGRLTHKESITLFSALWFLIVFIFFSISRTKLPGYILPLSPAVAILVGSIWDEHISSASKNDRWMRLSLLSFTIIGLLVSMGLALAPIFLASSGTVSRFFQGPVEGLSVIYLMGVVIFFGILLSLLSLWRHQRTVTFGVMAGMMTLVTYILLTQIVPLADRYLQSPLKDYAKIAGTQLERNEGSLIVYGLNKPSIVFYARRPAIVLSSNQKDRLTEAITSSKMFYIITKGPYIDGLLSNQDIYLIDQRDGYALLSNHPPQARLTRERAG